MSNKEQFCLLVGGYFGITEMDEYQLKEYVLKEIEEYIIKFLKNNPIPDFDYLKKAEEINNTVSLKRKLQDSLLVLNKIKGKLELKLLIKQKINELK
ncbi:MAG: hypothetical protein HFJ02_03970 [Bacilli bacterium]|jgi:hypothetical protein|nr:hypothetical protein [Bacilli bacterium]